MTGRESKIKEEYGTWKNGQIAERRKNEHQRMGDII